MDNLVNGMDSSFLIDVKKYEFMTITYIHSSDALITLNSYGLEGWRPSQVFEQSKMILLEREI